MANLYNKAGLVNIPVGYSDGFLYNIKPTDNTLAFRFDRASSATRVNEQGLIEQVGYFGPELVTNGNFETDSDWIKQAGWSINNGKANAISAQNLSKLQQYNLGQNINRPYKITFTISNLTEGFFKVWFGTVQSDEISNNGDYIIYLTPTTTQQFFFFANGTTTGSIDNVSVTEVLGDKPRIDYTDSLTSPSFLLEPQRTNLITYSEDFTQSIWTNARSSGAANQIIAPDGTTTGYKLIDSTDNNTHLLFSSQTVPTSSVFAFSVFLKKGSLNNAFIAFDSSIDDSVVFDLQNGTIVSTGSGVTSSKIESFDNDWYRCSFTHTPTFPVRLYRVGTYNGNISYAGSGSDFVYCWGAQLEQGSYPTSYIPTSGSTSTRAAETCNGAGNASTFNDSEGVLYAEIAALANDSTNRIFGISDGGDFNNSVLLRYSSVSNRIQAQVRLGGVYQCSLNYDVTDATEFNKIAFKYKQNDFSLFVNGIERATDTSGNVITGLDVLDFDISTTNEFYGKVKGVYVFNEALTDDELQQLTGPEYNSFAALAAAYNYTVI